MRELTPAEYEAVLYERLAWCVHLHRRPLLSDVERRLIRRIKHETYRDLWFLGRGAEGRAIIAGGERP